MSNFSASAKVAARGYLAAIQTTAS